MRRLSLPVLAILVLACAAMPSGAQSESSKHQTQEAGQRTQAMNLAMGQWRFVAIGETQITAMGRQQPYLKFEDRTHTVTGFTGCNRLRGSYRADESSLSFENVVSTRMACARDTYEPQVLEVLHSATGYEITGHELHVLGPKGRLATLIRPHQEQTMQQKPAQK
jgi:heat shock protein HslJ